MKYRITITKIETVKSVEDNWEKLYDDAGFQLAFSKDPKVKQYGYEHLPTEKEVSKQIYDQVREAEFDLMAVITAFNK